MLSAIIRVSIEAAWTDRAKFAARFWFISIIPFVIGVGYGLWSHTLMPVVWGALLSYPWNLLAGFLCTLFNFFFRRG